MNGSDDDVSYALHTLSQTDTLAASTPGFVVGTTADLNGQRVGTVVPARVTCTHTFTYREMVPLENARGFHDARTAVAYFNDKYTKKEPTPPRHGAGDTPQLDKRQQQRNKRQRLARATETKKQHALQNPATCTCTSPCACFEQWRKNLRREFTVSKDDFTHRVQGEIIWKAFRRACDGVLLGPFAIKVHWHRAADARSIIVQWALRD